MNSYPSEFLMQLEPVMFIAGLDIAPNGTQSDSELSEEDRVLGKHLHDDPFVLLTKRLRHLLQEKSLKSTVWVGDKSRASGFRMLLVDKAVRFPPQKANGQDPHSPLSPLTPTSPLHPDGLIAPIWLRKHIELLPAVFVLFLRLYEPAVPPSASPISPLHTKPVNENDEDKQREEERRCDSALSAEIAVRKRGCSERGVKLTVVLMATRKMLDDPILDSRLTFIRRQSGLDSRATLFVLSPVNPTELQDFVNSLQSALHDASLEYYLNHSKRVRRKRSRHTGNMGTGHGVTYGYAGSLVAPTSAAFVPRAPVQPLRAQGWMVRYEYKLACFAEFRGEEEVARKHFQTSWEMLLELFGSTLILPPRTKRWAEAKVLADCISMKIIKLYMYRAEYSRAITHFNAHLTKFGDFSRGWGIGEATWEFWSWNARWYRALAELLDHAKLNTFTIPQTRSSLPASTSTPPTQHPSLEPLHTAGVNPSSVIQHPGFYYYAAAICTQRRLDQFMVADKEPAHVVAGSISTNLTNERKVDHRVIMLDLYTKAYEFFNKHGYDQERSRLACNVTRCVAQTYRDSGKFDMAVRLLERIARIYRDECWNTILKAILSMWYTCTRELDDVDINVRLLIEMMCYGSADALENRQLEKELITVMQSTAPINTPLKIDLFDLPSLFNLSVVFWQSDINISQPASFQLQLKALTPISHAVLPFTSLRVEFANPYLPVVIQNSSSPEIVETQDLQLVDLGSIPSQNQCGYREVHGNLRWPVGGTLVLTGNITSEWPTTLSISRVVLNALEGDWDIELAFDGHTSRISRPSQPYWLCRLEPPSFLPIRRENPSIITVSHRPHLIDVSFTHPSPAYLDETYPITISVTSIDDRDLNIIVDVLLHPAEDGTANLIIFGTEQSTSLIKGVSYGCLSPGATMAKTLYLQSMGTPGDRTLDVSIQCEYAALWLPDGAVSASPRLGADICETLHTLVIPMCSALKVESLVTYRRPAQSLEGLALTLTDFKTYEPSTFEAQAEIIIRSTLLSQGPWDITLGAFRCLPAIENKRVRLLSCSLDKEDDFPIHCPAKDIYSVASRFLVFAHDDVVSPEVLPPLGSYEVSWSRVHPSIPEHALAITRIPLPPISIPSASIDALLQLPASGVLHLSLTATLTICNRHPSRTVDVHLQLESSDNFVVSGLRSGSLSVLLPGSEEHLTFNLIPTSCGTLRLPTFKLLDRRKDSHEPQSGGDELDEKLLVIDARLEERNEKREDIRLMVRIAGEGERSLHRRVDAEGLTMFISPS